MNCPKCNSPHISGNVCEDCGMLLGDRPVGRLWVPGVGLPPREGQPAESLPLPLPPTTDDTLSIYDMLMGVQLAPKNPPGKKIPKEDKVVKLNLSMPRDLYESLKNEAGCLSTHIERGMRFYLEIMKERK